MNKLFVAVSKFKSYSWFAHGIMQMFTCTAAAPSSFSPPSLVAVSETWTDPDQHSSLNLSMPHIPLLSQPGRGSNLASVVKQKRVLFF